jgi:hypothetical protein
LAGDIPGRTGLGDGNDGFCSPAMLDERATADLSTLADETPAMAKVLSDNPAIHASAHVLTAAILRNWLSIVPSSGTELNFRHALARNAGQRTFKARAALAAVQSLIVKK